MLSDKFKLNFDKLKLLVEEGNFLLDNDLVLMGFTSPGSYKRMVEMIDLNSSWDCWMINQLMIDNSEGEGVDTLEDYEGRSSLEDLAQWDIDEGYFDYHVHSFRNYNKKGYDEKHQYLEGK